MNQVKSNGASSTLFQHSHPNKPNRSKFDLSRLVNFSIDTGMIVPFDCFPTLPDDDIYLNIKMAMDTLPLVQSSLTNYKVLIHWYYMKNRDLWKGWKTFITKGRSGNIELEIPKVDLSVPAGYDRFTLYVAPDGESEITNSADIIPKSKHSLAAFLGVPPDVDGFPNVDSNGDNPFLNKDYLPFTPHFVKDTADFDPPTDSQRAVINESLETGFNAYDHPNALPFMMYQSIVKWNYLNQNLLQDNKALFPDEGEDDWLIPYAVEDNLVNYISGRKELEDTDVVNYSGVYSSDETDVDLRLLRYAMFDDDYFTTGLPWLQRGSTEPLEADVTSSDVATQLSATLESYDANLLTVDSDNNPINVNVGSAFEDETDNYYIKPYDENDDYSSKKLFVNLSGGDIVPLLKATTTLTNVQLGITANLLRNLLALSVWQERNAQVDGSYNRMIFQHWAINPHSEEHKPVYIGGTAEYINFSTILQNSQSTESSPLGATAGFGSTSGGADLGHYKASDYGYVMGIMIIKPNTTYQQGVERFLSAENVFNDFIQPEFEGLSPQAILNKELYVDVSDVDNDNLFCYQERNTTYKVRQNVNRGLFQCKPDKDRLFGAFTQARWFDEKPIFSYQWLCMSPDNIRRDWLAYPVYPAFRCQILSDVKVVRSLSYYSEPNTFGF